MLYSIQAYRGLAVLLVALYHGTIRVGREYGLAPFQDLFGIGFSGVHLFFVLSGFIILTAHIRDVGVPSRLGWYLKRRLVRIYPIYWLVFFVLGGWKLVSVNADLREFALNAFLFMSDGRLVIPVSWTLLYEVIFYVAFSALVINRGAGVFVIAVWLAAILVNWGATGHHVLHPFNLLFIFGLAAAALRLRLKDSDSRLAKTMATASFALGIMLFVGTAAYYSTLPLTGSEWPDHPVTIVGFGIAAALLVLASTSPAIEAFFARRPLLGLLGDASYSIYLVHVWTEKTAFKLVKGIDPAFGTGAGQSQLAADMLLIFIVVVAVLCGIAVHVKIERPLLAYLRGRLNANGKA